MFTFLPQDSGPTRPEREIASYCTILIRSPVYPSLPVRTGTCLWEILVASLLRDGSLPRFPRSSFPVLAFSSKGPRRGPRSPPLRDGAPSPQLVYSLGFFAQGCPKRTKMARASHVKWDRGGEETRRGSPLFASPPPRSMWRYRTRRRPRGLTTCWPVGLDGTSYPPAPGGHHPTGPRCARCALSIYDIMTRAVSRA